MLIPYKVKNPPRHFPYATLAIIVLNTLVFAMTSEGGRVVREEIVDTWALRWGQSSFATIFTSMFLHGDIFHLAGNMLFLWVFGQAVEDRLRPVLYVALYLFTGFAGAAAHAALSSAGAIAAFVPMLGASGCVMGVMGAYWYLFSWSPVCIFYWVFTFLVGTFEVRAFWVIGAYFALDLLAGVLSRQAGGGSGVANFAHVGGAFAGALLVWALQVRRDTSDISDIRATQAEFGGDPSMLSCAELVKLVAAYPADRQLAVQYAKRAWQCAEPDHLRAAIAVAGRDVLMEYPNAVVDYLVVHKGVIGSFTSGDLLYLGRHCESANRPDLAIALYELLETSFPESTDVELALYRTAEIYMRVYARPVEARAKLEKLVQTFPNGHLLLDAEDLLRTLPGQQYGAAA